MSEYNANAYDEMIKKVHLYADVRLTVGVFLFLTFMAHFIISFLIRFKKINKDIQLLNQIERLGLIYAFNCVLNMTWVQGSVFAAIMSSFSGILLVVMHFAADVKSSLVLKVIFMLFMLIFNFGTMVDFYINVDGGKYFGL